MLAQNKRFITMLGGGLSLLLIPVLAMQFDQTVNWGKEDFALAALLISGTAVGVELALRIFKNQTYRDIIVIAIVLLAILLFIEIGVGLFGSPIAGD